MKQPQSYDAADVEPPMLSDYEKLRLNNIRRNEAKLKELGLNQPLFPARKKKAIKPSPNKISSTMLPPRRSTRKRRDIVYSEQYFDNEPADKKDRGGMEYNDDDNESEAEQEYEKRFDLPAPKKRRKSTTTPNTTSTQDLNNNENDKITVESSSAVLEDVITCERAKTGRSTCRKCQTKIEKGSPRVGMKAWIMGRQSMTWQCPKCFLTNLVCGFEASGRTKCKLSHQSFKKGELKLGTRSHTATSYFKPDGFRQVLQTVVTSSGLCRNNNGSSSSNLEDILCIDKIEGHDKLTDDDDRQQVSSLLAGVLAWATNSTGNGKKNTEDVAPTRSKPSASSEETTQQMKRRQQQQPKVGSKSGAKGRVEWKFGSYTCTGILLPSKETNTHCFAKTHKGNIKTLAKGKDYWSILG